MSIWIISLIGLVSSHPFVLLLILVIFSGGACKRFTPLLSALHDEAADEERMMEIVYVSSDDTEEQCSNYMKQRHGDWLCVPFVSPLRNELKQKYGVFAGKEAPLFPGTRRQAGIPTLVVISRDGTPHVVLDCDSSKVLKDVESQGTSFLDQWEQFKW